MSKRFLIPSALAFLFVACATVPYTHRHQFNIVSEDDEKKLGEDAYAEALKKSPKSENQEYQQMVRAVGERIKAAANKPDYNWEFNVLESKEVNAWCLPGGKVAFYSAIIPICKNENGIAVVMGHEVAHALAHHGAERMSEADGAEVVGKILSLGLGNADPAVQEGAMKAYGVGTQVGVLLPLNRGQESEADHIGLILMAKAGYDPNGAVEFWQRMMAQSQGKAPPAFLSTHPSDDKRIEQIKKWLPEALSYYKPR